MWHFVQQRLLRAFVVMTMALAGLLPVAAAVQVAAKAGTDCTMKCCARLKKATCKRVIGTDRQASGMRAGAECCGQCGIGDLALAGAPVYVPGTSCFSVHVAHSMDAADVSTSQACTESGFDRLRWQRPPPLS